MNQLWIEIQPAHAGRKAMIDMREVAMVEEDGATITITLKGGATLKAAMSLKQFSDEVIKMREKTKGG